MENYSLSDIAAVGGGSGLGGNNAWILIILFALIFGNGGFFGGNNAAAAATAQDIQRAVDLNAIQTGQANVAADVQRTTYETMGTVKDAAYNNLSEIRNIQNTIGLGFANMQNCCCDLKSQMLQDTASINANTTAATQKILDTIQLNKINELQAQVSELKTQGMLCGIPRVNPFAFGIHQLPCTCSNSSTTTTTTG